MMFRCTVYLVLVVLAAVEGQEFVCRAKVDVVFIFDASSSIKIDTFENGRKLGESLVDNFELGSDKARLSVISFGDNANKDIGLTDTAADVLNAIKNINKIGGLTKTWKAVKAARNELNNRGRTGVKKVIILFTDGMSTRSGNSNGDVLRTQAMINHNQGIWTVVYVPWVAIPNAETAEEFQLLASAPPQKYMVLTDDFKAGSEHGGLQNQIIEDICPDFPPCVCRGFGQSHYNTYDGAPIEFNGKCSYLLSRVTDPDLPDFRIVVKNKDCNPQMNEACAAHLIVAIRNDTFVMRSDGILKVNGEQKMPPFQFSYADSAFTQVVRQADQSLKLSTDFDLRVVMADSSWEIKAPKQFRKSLTGICGDCNANKNDDYTTKTGTVVSDIINHGDDDQKRQAYYKVASSYAVGDASKTCEGLVTPPTCPNWLQAKVYSAAFCGLILDLSGPFRRCIAANRQLAMKMSTDCIADVCACGPNAFPKKSACIIMETFARECRRLSPDYVEINWRHKAGCPLKCGYRQVYMPIMSACPATCADPESENYCNLGTMEGCACDPGFILEDNACIPISQCGCFDFENYYRPLGSVWFSYGCGWKFVCKNTADGFKQICVRRFDCPNAQQNCRVGDDPHGTYGCWMDGPCRIES